MKTQRVPNIKVRGLNLTSRLANRLGSILACLGLASLGFSSTPALAAEAPSISLPMFTTTPSLIAQGADKSSSGSTAGRSNIDEGLQVNTTAGPALVGAPGNRGMPDGIDFGNPPGTPTKEEVQAAATRLGINGEALQLAIEGLGDVYGRRYSEAELMFNRVGREFPESSLGPFGHVLLYQSWMLENYDFSKESQWQMATQEGLKRAEKAIEAGRAESWNEFVRGALMGVDSIYQLRKGSYIPALNNAVKAISAVERSIALDPEFADPVLCMGVYNYWRSVLSDKYWFLPSFGDKREEGIRQMLMARDKGVFTGPGARLALAYAYLQERQVPNAKLMCKDLAKLYPDNVINNLLLGRVALRERRLRHANWYFKRVKDVAPENWLVEYYLGLVSMRQRRFTASRDHFKAFLSHDGDVGGQAWAHYRLGDVYWQLFLDDAAKREWQAAVALDVGLKGPERRLEGSTPRRGDQVRKPRPPKASGPTDKGAVQIDKKPPPPGAGSK